MTQRSCLIGAGPDARLEVFADGACGPDVARSPLELWLRHHFKIHGRFRVTLTRSPRRRTVWSYQAAIARLTTITLATTIRTIIGHRLTTTPPRLVKASLPPSVRPASVSPVLLIGAGSCRGRSVSVERPQRSAEYDLDGDFARREDARARKWHATSKGSLRGLPAQRRY